MQEILIKKQKQHYETCHQSHCPYLELLYSHEKTISYKFSSNFRPRHNFMCSYIFFDYRYTQNEINCNVTVSIV